MCSDCSHQTGRGASKPLMEERRHNKKGKKNILITKTGFCNALLLAGPKTSGCKTFVQRPVPSGVKPENLIWFKS